MTVPSHNQASVAASGATGAISDRRALSMLDACLWALRAEVEAQLRLLTEIHRQLHHLSRHDPDRVAQMTRVTANLEQFLQNNVVVRDLGVTAVDESRVITAHGHHSRQSDLQTDEDDRSGEGTLTKG